LDALLGTMAHQQQENPAHKPGQRQSLDDDDFADMMGPPPPSGAAVAASTEELRKQLAAAKSEADALRAQLEALQRQQDQASSDAAVVRELTEQQARLQRDRSAEMQEQRRAELLAHFQRRSQEDKATSKEIFESTCTSYQTLVRQLAHAQRQARAIAQRAAAAGDDPRVAEEGVSQEEVLYSILFDYERRLWHLNNDLLSLRAIVDIHGADISHEARRVRESLETTIAILRMQLKEAHLQPHA
jgi:CRISPR/Cas system CMR subunit Cmr4 (Cas7 group RAMP superfamily)